MYGVYRVFYKMNDVKVKIFSRALVPLQIYQRRSFYLQFPICPLPWMPPTKFKSLPKMLSQGIVLLGGGKVVAWTVVSELAPMVWKPSIPAWNPLLGLFGSLDLLWPFPSSFVSLQTRTLMHRLDMRYRHCRHPCSGPWRAVPPWCVCPALSGTCVARS